MTNGIVDSLLAASTHRPSVLESRIFGTIGVVIAVVVVIGYVYFDIKMRRDRRRKEHEQSDSSPTGD
jgi:hypothetical protein